MEKLLAQVSSHSGAQQKWVGRHQPFLAPTSLVMSLLSAALLSLPQGCHVQLNINIVCVENELKLSCWCCKEQLRNKFKFDKPVMSAIRRNPSPASFSF